MNRSSFTAMLGSTLAAGAGPVGADVKAPYKIGATWPLTGPATTFLNEVFKGGQVAIDEINKAGGVNGHPLEVLVEDTAGTAQGGVAAMRKLVEVDHVAVIMTVFTNVIIAQIPLSEQLKIPVISQIETPGILDKATWCYTHAPTWALYIPLLTKDWKSKRIKRLYGLMLNNALGLAQGPACRAAAQSIGAEYGEALLDPNQTDFRGVAERVVAFDADAVVVGAQGGITESVAVRQLRELTTKAAMYSLGQVFTSKTFHDIIGPYSEGMIFAGLYLDPKRAPKFVSEFKALQGYVPGTQSAEQYDIVRMTAYALGKAGTNADGIRNVFSSLKNFPIIFGGTVDMGENHRTIIKAIGLYRVRSGQLVGLS
jgi:branched-chain amino acid transport system substrate-binding protein